MARGIGTRALAAGWNVQILGRDAAKAQALAAELGPEVTSGTIAEEPAGELVVLALYLDAAKEVVTNYGGALSGRTIRLAPAGASFVKAFNTTFVGTLATGQAAGQPLDVFIAGDNAESNAAVSSLVAAAGMRPLVVGPLKRARELEGGTPPSRSSAERAPRPETEEVYASTGRVGAVPSPNGRPPSSSRPCRVSQLPVSGPLGTICIGLMSVCTM